MLQNLPLKISFLTIQVKPELTSQNEGSPFLQKSSPG